MKSVKSVCIGCGCMSGGALKLIERHHHKHRKHRNEHGEHATDAALLGNRLPFESRNTPL